MFENVKYTIELYFICFGLWRYLRNTNSGLVQTINSGAVKSYPDNLLY